MTARDVLEKWDTFADGKGMLWALVCAGALDRHVFTTLVVRGIAPAALEDVGHVELADTLRRLSAVTDEATASKAEAACRAALADYGARVPGQIAATPQRADFALTAAVLMAGTLAAPHPNSSDYLFRLPDLVECVPSRAQLADLVRQHVPAAAVELARSRIVSAPLVPVERPWWCSHLPWRATEAIAP